MEQKFDFARFNSEWELLSRVAENTESPKQTPKETKLIIRSLWSEQHFLPLFALSLPEINSSSGKEGNAQFTSNYISSSAAAAAAAAAANQHVGERVKQGYDAGGRPRCLLAVFQRSRACLVSQSAIYFKQYEYRHKLRSGRGGGGVGHSSGFAKVSCR